MFESSKFFVAATEVAALVVLYFSVFVWGPAPW